MGKPRVATNGMSKQRMGFTGSAAPTRNFNSATIVRPKRVAKSVQKEIPVKVTTEELLQIRRLSAKSNSNNSLKTTRTAKGSKSDESAVTTKDKEINQLLQKYVSLQCDIAKKLEKYYTVTDSKTKTVSIYQNDKLVETIAYEDNIDG